MNSISKTETKPTSRFRLLMQLLGTFIFSGRKVDPKTGYRLLQNSEVKILKEFHKEKVKNVLVNRGVKEFVIDGYKVLARDEANAIRKVDKLKIK